VRYYHTLIEATKIAFADRNHYIADPAFAKAPVEELLSKEYAAARRALIDPGRAIDAPSYGEINLGSDTTYFTVIDKDRNAVSFINSIFQNFGSGIVAGDTGIVLQNRGAGFSLGPNHPNRLEPGKRPFHTIIPAMLFKDGNLVMSYGVMGGDIQPQGHVQVLVNLVDRGLNLQEAIDAPRLRYISGRSVMLEPEIGEGVIGALIAMGHERALRSSAAQTSARTGWHSDTDQDDRYAGRASLVIFLKKLAIASAFLVPVLPVVPDALVPFSYLDLRVGTDSIEGTLVVHIFDIAHELNTDPPEQILDLGYPASRGRRS
jgi:gamma-glutamyltranspeptidase